MHLLSFFNRTDTRRGSSSQEMIDVGNIAPPLSDNESEAYESDDDDDERRQSMIELANSGEQDISVR